MSTYIAELVGGMNDGRVLNVDEGIIRHGLILPLAPRIMACNIDDHADELVSYTTQRWRWDGTMTRGGAFRFRADT